MSKYTQILNELERTPESEFSELPYSLRLACAELGYNPARNTDHADSKYMAREWLEHDNPLWMQTVLVRGLNGPDTFYDDHESRTVLAPWIEASGYNPNQVAVGDLEFNYDNMTFYYTAFLWDDEDKKIMTGHNGGPAVKRGHMLVTNTPPVP